MALLSALLVASKFLTIAATVGVGCNVDKRTGTCSAVLLQTKSLVGKGAGNLSEVILGSSDSCNTQSWPDINNGNVCGDCKVLVDRFSSFYKTCDGYCNHIGRNCVGAWEENDDTCSVLEDMTCGQSIESSDAICECSVEQSTPEGGCYGQLARVAVDEGNGVGSRILTSSATACQQQCDTNDACNSFTLCPGWSKCWMKDNSFTGDEPTKQQSDCKTYYKKWWNCDTATDADNAPEFPPTSGCAGSSCQTIKVMSYNTEYRDYKNRMEGYAAKIREVAPAMVGLQECQDRDGLARLSGYTANLETGKQNYMLFDPSKVTLVSGGWMPIPRDDYAPRAITWGKFMLGDIAIWFFNTHLPHNHNEARSQRTHARIADMLLQKRKELGAEHEPTVVVGDMNSHASAFNKVDTGGFESNLEANGFVWAYTAKGNPGYPRIDHILYSAEHWTHSGCRDTGTGGSDHTSITCDLTLK